ncbi:hypothetical protein ON010_g14560 [Phytophthora cinnamomi]|nr:hypothetical protein ON010_g14560 [Phytophthora cinnamomi]
MVTGGDSRKTTLRLVSPYGHTGPLRCGSQVFLQLVDGEWAGQLLGINGEFITATKYSPAVFQLGAISDCHDAVACPEAATKPEPKPVEEGSPLVRSSLLRGAIPFKLRVMVYNVWLLPSFVSSFNEKISPWASQRASAIPRCLAPLDVDVVIFCEAFCSTSREKLVCGMKSQGYIYETKVVGDVSLLGSKKAIDGGCFAMSKYPLGRSEELTFGSIASGEDRYADKGIIYFQVRMPVTTSSGSETTQTVHVVGTHLQAWETPVAVATRNCQLMLMREFVDSLGLPKDEPVIFAGDMNVNKHADGAQAPEGEYTAMLDLLGVHEPELHGESPLYSFDPHTNSLAVDGPSSGGITERLDYIMVERSHRQPVAASTEIVQLKATRHWAPSRGRHEVLALLEREPRGLRRAALVHVRDAAAVLPVGHLPRDLQGERAGAGQRRPRAHDALRAAAQALLPRHAAGRRSGGKYSAARECALRRDGDVSGADDLPRGDLVPRHGAVHGARVPQDLPLAVAGPD